jgi:glycosyltransferase involved in cell wall biosynthesis
MRALCYHRRLGTLWGGAEAVALHTFTVCLNLGFKTIVVSDRVLSHDVMKKGANILGVRDLRYSELFLGYAKRIKMFSRLPWTTYYDDYINSFLQLRGAKCELYIDTKANLFPFIPMPSGVVKGYIPALLYIHWPTLGENLQKRRLVYIPLSAVMRQTVEKFKKLENVRLVANSLWTAKKIENVFRLDPTVVYPPVNVDEIPLAGQERERSAVAVGRFHREKKYEVIIKAMPLIKALKKLYIYATLEDRSYYEELLHLVHQLGLEDRIHLLPNPDRNSIVEILRRCQFYIHANPNETFGIAIVEAMAAGCIPIVPSTGGPSEYVPKELQYSSVEELVSIIEQEIERPTFSPTEMRKIAMRFSAERFRGQMRELISELIR